MTHFSWSPVAADPGSVGAMAPLPVVVLGAGVSGLVAARALDRQGRAVVVVDQARSPGGRLATRRLGRAVLDHGAQFFTVRGEELQAQTDQWSERGLVTVWSHGFGDDPDGHPRYVATQGMASLARDLAAGLDVRTGHPVDAVIPTPGGYAVTFAGGAADPIHAAAVVVTAPVPQSLAVLRAGGVRLDPEMDARLAATEYRRVLALLVRLDAAAPLRPPGAVQQPDDPVFTFVADNQAKGISPEPALTLHTAAALSSQLWDRPDVEVRRWLLAEASPWLGRARPVEAQLKRWRYAAPVQPWEERALLVPGGTGPLVLAGDAFAGPRVEGAHRSGLAAAALLA